MLIKEEEEQQYAHLDPLQFSALMMKIGQDLQNEYQKFSFSSSDSSFPLTNHTNIWAWMRIWQEGMMQLADYPEKMSELTENYLQDMNELFQRMVNPVTTGQEDTLDNVIIPRKGDHRFKDKAWNETPLFNYLKQSYLLWERWMRQTSGFLKEVNPQKAHQFDFYARQISDFFAPSNFLWTNPQALKKAIETNGQSLLQGIENLKRDLERGKGTLDIKTVNYEAFELGKNLATTPGEIIFQNELLQLIHYFPLTSQVYKVPLLIIPPCFNKFYIFDLRPETSFIQWCLRQGIQVFIVSWVNPDQDYALKSFEDYVFQGVQESVQVVQALSKVQKINAIGFCIGGNLLCSYSAWEAAQSKNSFASTSYFTTLFDHTESGDLKVFLNTSQLDELEEQIKAKGYMQGKTLAQTFSLMRANDLIWGFIINNYLLGQEPAAFDLLYWNADSTNLPAVMYLYYVREILINNNLMNRGGIHLKGIPLDLSQIITPSYFLSTYDDHIVPWRSSYAGFNLFKGPKKFVLGGSGHIAGVFNHPNSQKYMYWERPSQDENIFPRDAEIWFDQAQQHSGSWWENWRNWINAYLGEYGKPLVVPQKKFPRIEMAPGSYVMQKREN